MAKRARKTKARRGAARRKARGTERTTIVVRHKKRGGVRAKAPAKAAATRRRKRSRA